MVNQTNPQAIFLDMDGTLLDQYNRVSDNAKQVIDHIRKQGIYVFIATGRGKEEIYPTAPEGFEVDGVISSNGMTGYLGDELLFEHTLPFEVVKRIVEQAREMRIYYEVFPTSGPSQAEIIDQPMLNEAVKGPRPESVGINEWVERQEVIERGINWVERIEDGRYSKLYTFSKSRTDIIQWQKVLDQMKQELPFTTSSSTAHNIEIMVANKNKATGVKSFLDRIGLTSDQILVMGDSYNDLEMFKLAGHTVAMKNAPTEIQALADEVTTYTCNEDGVYHYLRDRFITV
ncbi:Cof-type HAD-IIB family hydrolase [Amphibacillus sediminis]|uniref:Cof-type HAD-IIB family hydrolase n=1 Tax=Amphibacillus sediminis TaxID=360185 RepID=UPI0008299AF6|nr:Cof-type HAD-IIB family hydrolase [Amphibacillus sediminis]